MRMRTSTVEQMADLGGRIPPQSPWAARAGSRVGGAMDRMTPEQRNKLAEKAAKALFHAESVSGDIGGSGATCTKPRGTAQRGARRAPASPRCPAAEPCARPNRIVGTIVLWNG